jgi:hypothetical protein
MKRQIRMTEAGAAVRLKKKTKTIRGAKSTDVEIEISLDGLVFQRQIKKLYGIV